MMRCSTESLEKILTILKIRKDRMIESPEVLPLLAAARMLDTTPASTQAASNTDQGSEKKGLHHLTNRLHASSMQYMPVNTRSIASRTGKTDAAFSRLCISASMMLIAKFNKRITPINF